MKPALRLYHFSLLAISIGLSSFAANAQSKGVPIESECSSPPQSVLDQAEKLRTQGQLLRSTTISAQLESPLPGSIQVKSTLTAPLQPHEVAELARLGGVHVDWYYLCPDCNHWHAQLAGGYAIARDAVATVYHGVNPSMLAMREGYLIAVDSGGIVRPVTGVLASSQGMDAAILHIGGSDLKPLALNDNVAQGDEVYCLSDPLGTKGYFSQGIVNRFYWMRGRSGKPGSLEELNSLRMNVSTEWAPGSSGAALLDHCGNAIGHVATISPLKEKGHPTSAKPPEIKPGEESKKNDPPLTKPLLTDRFQGAVLITLHTATPARGVLALVQSLDHSDLKPQQ